MAGDRPLRGALLALGAFALLGAALPAQNIRLRFARALHGERIECTQCHGGIILSAMSRAEALRAPEVRFHNTALYNVGGNRTYFPDNRAS
jgi:hypothetical protein